MSRLFGSPEFQQHYLLIGFVLFTSSLEFVFPRRDGRGGLNRRLRNVAIGIVGLGLTTLAAIPLLLALRYLLGPLALPTLASLPFPPWAQVTFTFLILDLIAYLLHRLSHKVPLFWRWHRLHHSDQEFDATTGLLHHPWERLALGGFQLVMSAVLGLPLVGVIAYSVISNLQTIAMHGNLRLSIGADRLLRLIVITPDHHRVHHSSLAAEGNTNFGQVLSIWDGLFGTYKAQPSAGHAAMTLGLWADPKEA